ncbi:hypothetical protein LMTR13_19775 [Bradyrhizobium icense]|uniref:Uncharacterized protein n=1 Tax=Bradyrhizobium icense TaxID=1274631 RepID=A0A1B1UH69_9BRAD|nr:hypothetical protein LMTR13_19775 [Bradyrhizobium icense]
MIARAAGLVLPWHRARRIAEPIADIDVRAMAARYRPSAAAILQGVIPARLKPRRHRSVRVALAVPLIEVVAVAARRWMAATAVPDFLGQAILGQAFLVQVFMGQDSLGQGGTFVLRVGRHSQL